MRPIIGPLRISIVNYLNTLPFRWALHKNGLYSHFQISEDYPSICAAKLLSGEVDLALIPVAALKDLPQYSLHTSYCIGAKGVVDSVKLYHEVPVNQVKTILLDYQSRTSVALTRVLVKHFWKKEINFVHAQPGFEALIRDTTAAVVIGDRTFDLNNRFTHETDLAQAWKEFTGLPFVFAAWASVRPLPEEEIILFNNALREGVQHIEMAVKELWKETILSKEIVFEYLSNKIDYSFDEAKQQAMALFFQYLKMTTIE